MKGIVLAGGTGSRLYPITLATNKQLLPVYDKPMIYYPLSVLMLAGLREILMISTPADLPRIRDLLGDGSQFGIAIDYVVQDRPRGIAEALILAEDFLAGDASMLILGDNIFHGHGLTETLRRTATLEGGATVFAYWVQDPERYGVIALDADGGVRDIVEKPADPPSQWAVTGLYAYDGEAPAIARSLVPSARGELEITDLNRRYLERGRLSCERLGRGYAWLDTGTYDSLLEAGEFVRTMQHRQGLQIACLEEIAFDAGWIDPEALARRAAALGPTAYARYLTSLHRQRGG
ncbi:MAG: glucose-1-phosphate thymidylyltransferase RfbA [Azospirillaceae bacterium]